MSPRETQENLRVRGPGVKNAEIRQVDQEINHFKILQ